MATDEMEQLLRRISDSMKLGMVCVDDLEKCRRDYNIQQQQQQQA